MKKTLLLLIFLSVFFSVEAQKKVQKKQAPTKTSAVKKKPLTKPDKETIKAKIATPKAVTTTVTKPTNISDK